MTTTKPAHGLSIHGRLDKLIAAKQQDLDALLRTKALLNGVAKNGKVHTHEAVLARAVAFDEDRRAAVRGPYKKKAKRVVRIPYSAGGAFAAKKKADRKRTAAFLARVAKSDGPYTGPHNGRVSVLIQHGYLKAQGEGFVRTDKVFTP